MAEKVRWRLYYDDFSTYDNLTSTPWDCPGRGLICIVQIDPSPAYRSVNTQLLKEHPYYWYHMDWGYWMGSDRDGVLDIWLSDREDKAKGLKQGRWTSYEDYDEILRRARSDPDFYPKSGTSTAEMSYKQ